MKISWWLLDRGQRKARTDKMRGPGLLWDATCVCGWDSDTGGVTMGEARALVNQHKAEGHGAPRGLPDATGAARNPESDIAWDAARIELRNALALIEAIDRLPAGEGIIRIAQDDAQRALEIVGRAKSRSGSIPADSVDA